MVRKERLDFNNLSDRRRASILGNTKQRINALRRYYKDPNHCKNCSSIIEVPEQRQPNEVRDLEACSRSCSAELQEHERSKQKCLFCRTEGVWNGEYFCSQKCWISWRYSARINRMKEENIEISGSALRRTLLWFYGNECLKCKRTEWNEKKIPVDVDHVDGNADNNRWKNVRLLCLNCHGQTETYKARNDNSSRQYRRKRYEGGKTY